MHQAPEHVPSEQSPPPPEQSPPWRSVLSATLRVLGVRRNSRAKKRPHRMIEEDGGEEDDYT